VLERLLLRVVMRPLPLMGVVLHGGRREALLQQALLQQALLQQALLQQALLQQALLQLLLVPTP